MVGDCAAWGAALTVLISLRRQVTLRGPADIQGSVSLRGEEDGWWGRAESSLLAAVLAAGGHPDATPDEFFFQVDNKTAGMV